MLLELALVELRIVEGGELGQQAPESLNEPELSGDDVGDETELRLPRELERILGFSLHIAERLSHGEQERFQKPR